MESEQQPAPPPQAQTADKPVGIILMILSGSCSLCGVGVVGLGGLAAGFGREIAKGATTKPNDPTNDVVGAFSAFGALTGILGLAIIAAMVLNFIGALLLFKSRRTGFYICGIMGAVIGVLTLVGTHGVGLLGLMLGIGQAIYCYMRLFGNFGTKPA